MVKPIEKKDGSLPDIALDAVAKVLMMSKTLREG